MTDRADPIGRDLTRQRAAERLSVSACCVLCGERDSEVLAQRPAGRVPATVLEVHHVAGRVNDPDLTVVLCLNCHRRLSARLPFYGVVLTDSGSDPGAAERLVAVLRGIAAFLEQLAYALTVWADEVSGWRQPGPEHGEGQA